MRTPPRLNFFEILRVLTEHDVHFIVVGGISAVLHGAPYTTFDLDVVHSRDPLNIERLLRALQSLEAYYRFQPERRLEPSASHLSSPGHQLLTTRFGHFDILGMIGNGQDYEELSSHTVEMDVGEGVKVQVLDLETLIRTKEDAGADKDKAVLPLLRQTLNEKNRR